MKSKIYILAIMLFSVLVFSQEVKVKKGEIQIDGKSVAKIDKEKTVYTISDLSGKPLFKAVITNVTPLRNTATRTWLQLTGNNGVVRELDLIKRTSFSFGFEKPITENLTLSDDPLLPASGIDEAKINKFFQTEDRSISTAEDIVIEKDKKIAKSEDSIAAINKVVIGKSGIINSNGNKIGYIALKTESTDGLGFKKYSYNLLDINKLVIGKMFFSNTDGENARNGLVMNMYDGKAFPVKAKYTSELAENDELALRIVNKMYANGYTLGDMKSLVEIAKQEKTDEWLDKNKKAEAEAKANSKNIYDADGYVIDKDGKKKDGKITIEFESIDAKLGRDKNISDFTNYGGTVTLTVDGKQEFYKAKDGNVKFCAGERCFLGTETTSLITRPNFYEIVAEQNGNYVVADGKTSPEYYLKLSNQSKAVYLGDKGGFGTRKPEKIKKIFDEYVNCSALDFANYDTNTKEGLMQIMTDYSAKCKK